MSVGDESARGSELERLQRWMQAVVTHPGGVGHGVASAAAQERIALDTSSLETVVAPSATLSGAERLAIYCRSYHARLLQCFRETFPALLHALGEELFDMFALEYLKHHPPRSYTLDHLADGFAQHLAETRPDADAPTRERESWPDFIVELCAIEWAFRKIYDGPGVEGRALPRAEEVLALSPVQLLAARPALAPCLRLFAFRYPVHAYMLAVRGGENPKLPAPAETFVAATRLNYRVRLYELSAPQYAFLQSLDTRRAFGQTFRKDMTHAGCPPPFAALRQWLGDWAGKGFFESIQLTQAQ